MNDIMNEYQKDGFTNKLHIRRIILNDAKRKTNGSFNMIENLLRPLKYFVLTPIFLNTGRFLFIHLKMILF